MNKFSHILSTNYVASVTRQPSWNLCLAPIFCLIMMMMMMMTRRNLLGSYMGGRPSAWATTARLVQRWTGALHSHRDGDNHDDNGCNYEDNVLISDKVLIEF